MKGSLVRSKKGFMYDVLMVLVVAVLLTSISVALFVKQANFKQTMGDLALQSMNTYKEGEKTLFNIDLAAKYAAYNTVYELAENGGLYRPSSECGDYFGYPLWFDGDNDCSPKNIKQEFILTYNNKLNKNLETIIEPDTFFYTILRDSPLKIIGSGKKPLEFDISYITEEPIQRSTICPIPELVDMSTIGIQCVATQSTCALTPEAIQALDKAQKIAQREGFELLVTSGRRTYEQQVGLRASKGELAAKAGCTAPHVTGGAVDLVLKGQPFMTSRGYPVADMTLGKRQKLEDIMCEAGFVRYKGEFWHYEYGTARWQMGKAAGVCAI